MEGTTAGDEADDIFLEGRCSNLVADSSALPVATEGSRPFSSEQPTQCSVRVMLFLNFGSVDQTNSQNILVEVLTAIEKEVRHSTMA